MILGIGNSALLDGRVMHHRLVPREHRFSYGICYRAEVIGNPQARLRAEDHGFKDGTPLGLWANAMLARAGFAQGVERVVLMAMPRVLGYVFNPVSFWFCLDAEDRLRAVLCEVNNTFGETHTYVCSHTDQRAFGPGDWLEGNKVFHVSPFMDRQGSYRFQFAIRNDRITVLINHLDPEGQLLLRTSLSGTWVADTRANRIYQRLRHPMASLATIGLIHYHAMRLALKRVGYRAKPRQLQERHSLANGAPVQPHAKPNGDKCP